MLPYTERLWPTPGYWLLALVVGAFVATALMPLGAGAAMAGGAVAAGATAAALARGATTVAVDAESLRAGRARIEVACLGPAEVLDAAAARRVLGVESDVRAYLVTRPWVRTGVRIPVTDPRDATPYWFVATRRPADLAAALAEAAAGRGPQAAHSEQTS